MKNKTQKDFIKSTAEEKVEEADNHNQNLNLNQNSNQNNLNKNQKKLTKTTMCENEHNTNTSNNTNMQNQKNQEAIIANEPIYENISKLTATQTDTVKPATETVNDDDKLTAAVKITENIIPNIIKENNINNNKLNNNNNNNKLIKTNYNNNNNNLVDLTTTALANNTTTTSNDIATTPNTKPTILTSTAAMTTTPTKRTTHEQQTTFSSPSDAEPYYQVPKSMEPYYDAPKHSRPIPVYENIEVFYTGLENSTIIAASATTTILGGSANGSSFKLEPPKEKPPPPPTESPPPLPPTTQAFTDNKPQSEHDTESITDNADTWSSDNTYETISTRHLSQSALGSADQPSPPIKRMNSTKRIKKELRNKRSSFLGIESAADDEETYLELTVAPPPDMAQLLQEERRLEKQLYMKAGLCDSSDTGESRDSGVSENHSRQSSEHYTNSSEENDRQVDSPPMLTPSSEVIYQNETNLLTAAQTPLLQTVKGNSAESWTESATAAAAATKSLTEATATANAKMLSIEEKIREQEEVLRVERELLQLEQEELKRQRENLMLRENMARRELQHGAKMLMSANRRSLQDLNGNNGVGVLPLSVATNGHHLMTQQQQVQLPPQQIYANVPNLQQQQQQLPQQQFYHQVETDYRKSMSDLNEFSKRLNLPPAPPTKPMRHMHITTNGHGGEDLAARQRHSLNTQSYGGSLIKIAAAPTAAPRSHIYSNNYHHQSTQNLSNVPHPHNHQHPHHGNMSRNALHALSATPKPKYTDGWVQVQNRKSYENANLANDPAWVSAYQQKRKSMPDAYHAYNNHWLVQEAEQRRLAEQQRRSLSSGNTPVHLHNGNTSAGSATVTPNSNGKPLPDSIIQTLTERVQSKGIGERKRFDNYSTINPNSSLEKSPLHAATSTVNISSPYHQHQHQHQKQQSSLLATSQQQPNLSQPQPPTTPALSTSAAAATQPDKVLSVSGKKKCSHCGDELGKICYRIGCRGAAMIIESLLLFYHINCFKCCVCHVQLGDGLNGTDVRVRNHKLHCQNCYSSDDGIKFSCV